MSTEILTPPDLYQAVISETELDKEQAWLNQRKGKFTASEFFRLMGYEDKDVFPDGAKTYVTEKVIEMIADGEKKQISNDAIIWGKENEFEAVEKFIEIYGYDVYAHGEEQKFIQLTEDVGCTPDGLISLDFGIEVKCPDSKTHLDYLENLTLENFKKECTKYYWQIQGSMYISNRKAWFFISYDPRFRKKEKRIFVLRIERNEADIAKLQKRLTEAIKIKRQRIKAFE